MRFVWTHFEYLLAHTGLNFISSQKDQKATKYDISFIHPFDSGLSSWLSFAPWEQFAILLECLRPFEIHSSGAVSFLTMSLFLSQ